MNKRCWYACHDIAAWYCTALGAFVLAGIEVGVLYLALVTAKLAACGTIARQGRMRRLLTVKAQSTAVGQHAV